MATAHPAPIFRHLRRLAVGAGDDVPDRHLLARFVRLRDEDAFAALVRRHGPLVLGVACRVLGERHAAEDCLQSTFLVLARKARFLAVGQTLGPWLYRVAYRTALKARTRSARQRRDEAQGARVTAVEEPDGLVWSDLRPVLDEMIAALPEKYRAAFVLCHLEGLTVAQAGRRLGCPQGTVAGRLARAKERLRGQLSRRGITLSAAALAALDAPEAGAAVPAALACSTAQAALLAATGQAASIGLIAATGTTLVKGVLQTMSTSKLATTVFLLVLAAGTTGVGLVARQAWGEAGSTAQPAPGNAQRSEPNLEERICTALRENGCWHSPAGDLAIWGDPVDGRRFLEVVLMRRDERGRVVVLTTCQEAELKVDPEKRTLLVRMKKGQSRSYDGNRAYFVDRVMEVPFAQPRVAQVSPIPPKPSKAAEAASSSAEAYVLEPPDILHIEASEKLGLPNRSLEGHHLVRPDGTITLGTYGTVTVTGMTLDQATGAIAARLKKAGVAEPFSAAQIKRALKVEVVAFNSKVCYVITDLRGKDSQVYRFPADGNHCVLDVLTQVDGLPAAGKCRVRIARLEAGADQPAKVLAVDWEGITRRGQAATNYQLLPGDRVFVESADVRKAPADPMAKKDSGVLSALVASGGMEAAVPGGATIRVGPDAKVKLTQVKTEQGNRLRLVAGGVVIEAPRLRLKSEGTVTEVEATEGGDFQVRTYPVGK
jgi:RNA polymerase sigma factor (sigma-70 family)